MIACQKGSLKIVKYLMKSGANIAEKDCVSLRLHITPTMA